MEYRISKNVANLTPSLTLVIDAKAKQLKEDGQDVVGFGAGQPDFDTPQHIKDAAIKALREGKTKYTPSSGLMELRKTVATVMSKEIGTQYDAKQVIISCGGKHACFNTIMTLCQSGDEVLIPSPYWLSYPEMVKVAGGTPVFLKTTDKTNFKITPDQLESAITPKTRLLILNSPSNPTGSVYTPDELRAIGKVCVEKNILIMSDEIYSKLVYDDAVSCSIASLAPEFAERTVIVTGLSKAYSMTGWRIGITVAPQPIANAVSALQSHSTSNPVSFAQWGAIAALTGSQDHLPAWLAEYSRRRSYAFKRLNAMKGLSCVNAKGAFYLFPNITETGLTSSEFATRLLNEELVALVPGVAFGADNYVRISYATSMEAIEKGMDRMERFCQKL